MLDSILLIAGLNWKTGRGQSKIILYNSGVTDENVVT